MNVELAGIEKGLPTVCQCGIPSKMDGGLCPISVNLRAGIRNPAILRLYDNATRQAAIGFHLD